MTQQQFGLGRATGVAQGLQGLRANQQQYDMGRMQMQYAQEDRAAQQAQVEADALRQQQFSQLAEQYQQTQDPTLLPQMILNNPELAGQVIEQLGATDEARRTDLINKGIGLNQALDAGPERAMQYFQESLGGDPAFAGIVDQLQAGDIEGARNEVRIGLAALGGREALNAMNPEQKKGQYNPRDYTPESWAIFDRDGDPAVLERYAPQQSVDIGGVPHVFNPTRGGYFPATMGEGEPTQGGQPEQPDMQPQRPAQPITVDTVAETRARIAGATAEAVLPSQLASQGLRTNPETGEQEVIPGSKIDRDLQQANEKEASATEMQARSGRTLIEDLGRGIEMIQEKSFASGAPAAWIPRGMNRQAQNLQSMIDSIESNVSVNSLNEMRASSPTGGALGNVSDKQSALLAGLLGNLDITQDPEVLSDNMKRIQNIFMDIVHGVGQGPERNRLSFDEMGRRVENGREWRSTADILELQAENQRQQEQAEQGAMTEQDADDFINSILGGQ